MKLPSLPVVATGMPDFQGIPARANFFEKSFKLSEIWK